MARFQNCPCCTWGVTEMVVFRDAAKPRRPLYFVRCSHCGISARKSRFRWRARFFWNHLRYAPQGDDKKRRYSIYGREY